MLVHPNLPSELFGVHQVFKIVTKLMTKTHLSSRPEPVKSSLFKKIFARLLDGF